MSVYRVKSSKLAGTSYTEVVKKARYIFRAIESKSRRRPYIRSAYFDKDKVFFDYFWMHLHQKSKKERLDRLVFLPCAIELMAQSRLAPTIKINPNRHSEMLYRFEGVTGDGVTFYIQIKENRRKQKFLMSVFRGQ